MIKQQLTNVKQPQTFSKSLSFGEGFRERKNLKIMNPTITNFWNYFKNNNFVFLLTNEVSRTELKKHCSELNNYLNQYNKNLDFIIKNKTENSELIITANGNPYLFKEIELLVYYAPPVERWKIIAFLQPQTNISIYKQGTDKPVENYGIALRISEIYFEPLENPQNPINLGIIVYLKNYSMHKGNPKLREVVYAQLEYLIGEKSFANNLNFIDIDQLPSDTVEFRLFKLYKLQKYIKNFKKNLKTLF